MEENAESYLNLPAIQIVGQVEVVLQNIFQYLDGEDLKSCRLVCQKWNYVSLGVFQEKTTVVFRDTEYARNPLYRGHGTSRSSKKFISEFANYSEISTLNSFYFRYKYGLLKENPDLQFLQSYGTQIKNFTATVDRRNKSIPLVQLLEFRNNIFQYIPNVENLSVRTLICLEPTSVTILITTNENDAVPLRLTNMKKLRLYLGIVGDSPPNENQNKLVTFVFSGILNSANSLQCLETSISQAKIAALLTMSKRSLSGLKILRLTDWRCYGADICNAFQKLTTINTTRDLKLQLHSLSVHLSFKYCENDDILNVVQSLLKFINSQKNYLEKLQISLPGFTKDEMPVSTILEGTTNLIKYNLGAAQMMFPKMDKLKTLDLSPSHNIFMCMFPNAAAWTELFPSLETFEHSYLLDMQNAIFPAIIENITTVCQTVTKVNVNFKIHSPDLLFRCPIFSTTGTSAPSSFTSLYLSLREKFPNMKGLRFYHQLLNMVYEADNENPENLVAYSPDRTSLARREDLMIRNEGIRTHSDDDYDEENDIDFESDDDSGESEIYMDSDSYDDDDWSSLDNDDEDGDIENEFSDSDQSGNEIDDGDGSNSDQLGDSDQIGNGGNSVDSVGSESETRDEDNGSHEDSDDNDVSDEDKSTDSESSSSSSESADESDNDSPDSDDDGDNGENNESGSNFVNFEFSNETFEISDLEDNGSIGSFTNSIAKGGEVLSESEENGTDEDLHVDEDDIVSDLENNESIVGLEYTESDGDFDENNESGSNFSNFECSYENLEISVLEDTVRIGNFEENDSESEAEENEIDEDLHIDDIVSDLENNESIVSSEYSEIDIDVLSVENNPDASSAANDVTESLNYSDTSDSDIDGDSEIELDSDDNDKNDESIVVSSLGDSSDSLPSNDNNYTINISSDNDSNDGVYDDFGDLDLESPVNISDYDVGIDISDGDDSEAESY